MSQTRYQLGVDLGTTYTAAAVCRDGQERPEVVALGSASTAVASVVFLGPDGAMVVGEAALRRALTEPRRIAREFKRRIGDGTPLHVGGAEVAAHELSARFLAWVVDEVAAREGGYPDAVTVTHPVEWGAHKRATFAEALAVEGLGYVEFLIEPQAAAIGYASTERIDVGDVVGVYDLGGGTFDAAVVRKLADGGFALLGSPTGIERLGGVDFDDAVLDHVRAALGDAWTALDPTDPRVQSAVAGLRRECTAAKEALSADTEVLIPVMLPGTHTEVRLGRAEFEDMIRPSVGETVEALRRAIDSAGLAPTELDAVLLVGGSSRIPLVSQMVSAELGRSVAVDADPKAVVAAGAALAARGPALAPVVELLDGAPEVPPVEFDAPPAEEAVPRYRRRTLVLAASIAVVATFGLSATLATGVAPVGIGGSSVAQADSVLDGDAPAAVDPWTGAPDAETTVPGPRRPDAVAAAVRPVSRNVPTGAAGASAVTPTPGAPVPVAPPPPAGVAPPVVPAPVPAPAVVADQGGTQQDTGGGTAAEGGDAGSGGGTTGGTDGTGGTDAGGNTGGTGGGDTSGGDSGGGDTGGGDTGGGDTGGGDTGGGDTGAGGDAPVDPVDPPAGTGGGSEGDGTPVDPVPADPPAEPAAETPPVP